MDESCRCFELPAIQRGDTEDPPVAGLVEVDHKYEAWVRLFRCPACGQHWQLDQWDKHQVGLAIKIDDPGRWALFNDRAIRLDFLIASRGGLSEEMCRWAGCGERCLKGLALCPRHAFDEMGLRA